MAATDVNAVPVELQALLRDIELEDACDVFSMETWDRILTDAERAQLRTLLPPPDGDAQLADDGAVRLLFTATPILFGAPLPRFWAAMQADKLTIGALEATAKAEAERRASELEFARKHHNEMVHRLHYLKRTYTPPAPPAPPKLRRRDGEGGEDFLKYSKTGGLERRVGVPGRKVASTGKTAGAGKSAGRGRGGGNGGEGGAPRKPRGRGSKGAGGEPGERNESLSPVGADIAEAYGHSDVRLLPAEPGEEWPGEEGEDDESIAELSDESGEEMEGEPMEGME